jgi:hypothetical protein
VMVGGNETAFPGAAFDGLLSVTAQGGDFSVFLRVGSIFICVMGQLIFLFFGAILGSYSRR